MGVSITRSVPNSADKPGENFEDCAGLRNVLAHDEYTRIAAHLLGKRFSNASARVSSR